LTTPLFLVTELKFFKLKEKEVVISMVRIQININYLEEINSIKEYLRDTPKSRKSIKAYLLALDKFFPYLINRFKDNIKELKDFTLKDYYKLNTTEMNNVKANWVKDNIHNKIFEEWKKLSPEKKSDILMKWVNDSIENKYVRNGKTEENTYLNYAWRIQGLISKLGRDFEANPKTMEKLKRNGTKIGSMIDYEDVIELYDKLNNDKYKLILKIMMYSGLNQIDILDLKSKDFIKIDSKALKISLDRDYYYIKKERIKTKHKNAEFLLIFTEEFFNEIKSYFERKIIVNYTKDNIKKYKSDNHFFINEEKKKAYFKYDWNVDKKEKLFGNIKPNTVTDTFRYCIEKHNLNLELKPMAIRRLCFTLLKKIFPLEDKYIYDLWTQHKIGLVDNFYITDTVERIIKDYVEKIESLVLIGNLKEISTKINGFKEKVDKIYNLEKENVELRQTINKMKADYDKKLEEIDKNMEKWVKRFKEYDKERTDYIINEKGESIGLEGSVQKLKNEKWNLPNVDKTDFSNSKKKK